MAIKKIPQRKCIGCNTSKDKKDLIRIVKSPTGEISIDMTGKKSGRGAYICPSKGCLKIVQKSKKLERTFDSVIEQDIYDKLSLEIAEDE